MKPRALKAIVHSVALLTFGALLAPTTAAAQDLGAYLGAHGYHQVPLVKLPTGHETVRVVLNGVEGVFILDSGAGATVIHTASLSKYALVPLAEGNGDLAIGAGGATAIARYPIQSLTLGGMALNMTEVRGMDLSGVVQTLKSATGADIDGVIGQDVLTRFGGVIDVGAQRLFLRDSTQTNIASPASGSDGVAP